MYIYQLASSFEPSIKWLDLVRLFDEPSLNEPLASRVSSRLRASLFVCSPGWDLEYLNFHTLKQLKDTT